MKFEGSHPFAKNANGWGTRQCWTPDSGGQVEFSVVFDLGILLLPVVKVQAAKEHPSGAKALLILRHLRHD
jgi:hypothetical protein